MKSTATTASDMRAEKVPTPATLEELREYIASLIEREHDYGTAVYAMSLAATATFNHVATKLGVTGFQASCADLDILRRRLHLECPFIILEAEDMLYPQYNLTEKLHKAMGKWRTWAAEESKKKLAEDPPHLHPDVKAHWELLAAYQPSPTTKNNE